jgi:hypothetical protein
MKQVLIFFMILFLFSCAGTQQKKTEEKKPDTPVEAAQQPADSSAEEEVIAEAEPEPEPEIEPEAEIAQEEDAVVEEEGETENIEEYIAEVTDEPAQEPAAPVAAAPEPVPAPVQEPQVTPPAPAPVTAAPAPVPPPAAQRQPPSPPPSPAPAAPPAPSAQQPQPSSPAPAERGDLRSDLWKDAVPPVSTARDDAPIPSRTGLLVPQNNEEITFSRTVRATVGQTIEIPFRGTGWTFLGELASRRGLSYDSRRLDPEGQTFIFRAEAAGTYALKFFKQDFIRDYIINDHVQVIVGEPPVATGTGWFNPVIDRGRVIAEPRWPSAIDEATLFRGGSPAAAQSPAQQQQPSSAQRPQSSSAQQQPPSSQQQPPSSAQQSSAQQQASSSQQSSAQQPSSSAQQAPMRQVPPPQQTAAPDLAPVQGTGAAGTATPPSASISQGDLPLEQLHENDSLQVSPEELLQKAKETYDAGNVTAAIALLDTFMKYFPNGSDEAYWYYGQFYEANTPHRNILLSLDYYKRLINEYPQSSRFNDARRRIAYLERFYINIQ